MHPFGTGPITSKNPIFGTDGIRGKASSLLAPDFVLKIGFWCGLVIEGEGPFIIGQDSRQSSSMITSALSAGLTAAGREVWQVGLCPTPAIPHLIKQFGASGGLMVSASHNPPEDNGIKIFNSAGQKISLKEQRLIEKGLTKEINPLEQIGAIHYRNELIQHYSNSLLETANGKTLKDVSIVLDLCWGSATSCGEKIFTSLGATLKTIHSHSDGAKINVKCGSTNLGPLKEAVKAENAQMGFAFDGDADRVIAVDEKGRVIDGDHILYLWGSFLKEQNQLPEQRLVATSMSNLGLENAWLAKGGQLERTPVGDRYVQEKMLETNATLGGEQSGHILSKMNGLCGDGLLTAIQLATICNGLNLRLFEWLNQSFKPYPQKLINVPIKNSSSNQYWEESEALQEAMDKAKVAMGSRGRVLIRESGTEPLLRVMVESEDPKMVDSWSSHLASIALNDLNAA
ncbi:MULTISPECIES: phosphoglucosamine mutase [Prochlorococcus]|uniref:phosphoglucosamine mutase n=1 Tax=Prochlorococcus TaxID=1218 RepID=UPI000533BD93|nr:MULTISPECIES: phosphoglucosamine mutase [Prochlorococcus]KGG13124.1 Phosphoglucosamine mutase [Prochlorococcus sp. MIT 0601]